jgi:hypothetical protein
LDAEKAEKSDEGGLDSKPKQKRFIRFDPPFPIFLRPIGLKFWLDRLFSVNSSVSLWLCGRSSVLDLIGLKTFFMIMPGEAANSLI